MIRKSFFSNNTTYHVNGGAIYASYSNITVDNSDFSHNLASYGSGGAIYIYNGNGDFDLQINDTVLCRNRAFQGNGGAIYVYIYILLEQV